MYTNDPRQPKVRRDAVLFSKKHGVRCAARRYGVSPGTISKWKKKAEQIGLHPLPTKSSKPKSHPATLPREKVDLIAKIRLEHNRSAEVVHKRLKDEYGVEVSLSSVKRTLDRRGLLRKCSPWKKLHVSASRPKVEKPGDLVQVDTIHLMRTNGTRVYIFTCLDVHSRWAYARAYERCNTKNAIDFLRHAQAQACFTFSMIQSDNGPEFSTHFTKHIPHAHRHSRVRKPNDNAHLERFNRTLQTEVDLRWPNVEDINNKLPPYLKWYNEERHHFGLNLETPLSVIKCFQAID
jgi:transposase